MVFVFEKISELLKNSQLFPFHNRLPIIKQKYTLKRIAVTVNANPVMVNFLLRFPAGSANIDRSN